MRVEKSDGARRRLPRGRAEVRAANIGYFDLSTVGNQGRRWSSFTERWMFGMSEICTVCEGLLPPATSHGWAKDSLQDTKQRGDGSQLQSSS